ncbi:HD-GYP domain-containing protein [Vibrio cholerae]|uniref:HD-GYP domain-containing protein n=1 Tax=Vibrio cholerae TaxID=666 RepID=UPI0002D5C42C|nr:HD domain-containing phosphohydrolase [Vibrio cholerae]EJS1625224.1 HD-GYP domain-containing protein [Vibrio cholerae]ELM3767561.1 HD-GYP domain-containing protein [Vibrio cholerae]MDV2298031.1 HD-GYP domain-containing protein [Vibrio cholerae]MEE3774502.1 HD-GYP domain-containing protein [Vibrio cholerae]HDZ2133620.1 HD-GYP domain-containing protein [Vibrio cholerae]
MKSVNIEWNVNLRQAFFCIARALDSVGVDDINHGHRVGYMAYSCAQAMEWSEEECQLVFALGLIHDCGVAQKRDFYRLLENMQPDNTQQHCVRGNELLSNCPPLAPFADAILYHHTPWDELKNIAISDRNKRFAALIFLADRVDYLKELYPRDEYGNVTQEARNQVGLEIGRLSGSLFERDLVRTMQHLLSKEFIWFSMEHHHIEAMGHNLPPTPFFEQKLGVEEIMSIAMLMANVVDAKSQFTFQHSQKVAELCQHLAKELGLNVEMQKALYLTGLVHDIGKLHTPEEILHKPGKLNESEYLCIQRHSTDSRYTLQMVFGQSVVCEWAGNHHERLDGSGYPRGLQGSAIDLPSRIIAIADVFQALTQARPYRGSMSLNEVMNIMRHEVSCGRLDSQVFDVIVHNSRQYYQLSIAESPTEWA